MFLLNKKHRKIRDIKDYSYQCSLVGTCLTLKELRTIGRKAKMKIPHNLSDFDLHGLFVGAAKDTASYTHRQLQKFLDKKFKLSVQQFSKVDTEEELRQLWTEAVESADITGAYYALTTHTALSEKLLDDVFGDVHMLSHISGAAMRIDMQDHAILKQRIKKLGAETLSHEKIIRDKNQIIRNLEQHLLQSQQAENNIQMLFDKQSAANDPTRVIDLEEQVDKLSKNLQASQKQSLFFADEVKQHKADTQEVKSSNELLAKQLYTADQERDHLETTLASFLQPSCADSCTSDQKQECESMDLCGRCILYVGGRSKQCRHFRSLVERYNGRFIHHDGGLEDSSQRLNTILSQADTVMLPLNCISHDAMHKVKQHCKNTTKPLVMIPKSSLSAFSKGLTEAAPRVQH